MNGKMEIVQALENPNILFKGVSETIKNETKRRIPMNTGRHFRISLARKFIIMERKCKSWFWKQKRKKNCKSRLWK